MDRAVVSPRTVLDIGYDEETAILEVVLQTGATYQYYVVPADVACALATAPSAGEYLARSVSGRYRRRRIR
jgi:hypothetical protein